MSRNLDAQRVEEVPQTATVRDYDELTERGQQAVRRLVAGESIEQSDAPLDSDIVRFGDYYRITATTNRASD